MIFLQITMADEEEAATRAVPQFSNVVPVLPTGAPLYPPLQPPQNVTPFLDPYSEDITDYDYLRAKPACVIFVGKPGSGRSMLAKRLAKEWNFCYIHPKALIEVGSTTIVITCCECYVTRPICHVCILDDYRALFILNSDDIVT